VRGLKSTIALAVVLIGLGAYIFLVERQRPASDLPEKEDMFAVEADAIEEMTVTATLGERTVLRKSDGEWQVVEPIATDADPTAPGTITSGLATLEIDSVLEENPASVADYGLDPPKIEVAFRAAGASEPFRLLLGDKTPTGAGMYAKRNDEARVLLVSPFIDTVYNKTLFDLRDRRVLQFERVDVNAIEIVDGGSTVAFAKRTDTEWDLIEPLQARGDYGAIEGVLGALAATEVQQFIAQEPESLAEYGLDKPTVTVKVAGPKTDRTLLIGNAMTGTRYAKDSGRPGVFTVGDNLLGDIRKDVSGFRRKDVFDFRTFTANRVSFARGGETMTLERSAGEDGQDVWKLGDRTLETVDAEDPLTKFSNLRADGFEANLPAALSEPELVISASFDDEERTEEVRFGVDGDTVYAARDREPGAAKIPKTAFDEAVAALDALKE